MKIFLLIAACFCFQANAQLPTAAIHHKLPLKDCVPPSYPAGSKSRNEQGEVELSFLVLGNGIASDVTVKQSSGFIDLDNAAITAIKFCKFKVTELIPESGSIISSGKFNFKLEGTRQTENKNNTVYKPASKISCEPIKYPFLARTFSVAGRNTVSFVVGIDGNIRNPEIKISSGSELLDAASKENVEKCKYEPATNNGVPVESVAQLNFVWRFPKTATSIDPPFLNLHPQVKVCNNSEYPSASWRLEEEGTSRVKILISKDGEVLASEVLKSSGFRRLDEATRAMLSKQCQFEKLMLENEAVNYSIVFEYSWNREKENKLKFLSLEK
jgi:TonB family protein